MYLKQRLLTAAFDKPTKSPSGIKPIFTKAIKMSVSLRQRAFPIFLLEIICLSQTSHRIFRKFSKRKSFRKVLEPL